MDFRVQLDVYHGPLDLLLHLVRKQELEIATVPLAKVTQQFLDYVAVLEELDVDSIGDFVEVASLLVEIKSRVVLPQTEQADAEPEVEDAKHDLVERLLEFKKYRDAAGLIEQQGVDWRQRFARATPDLPAQSSQPPEERIVQVELWDLVCAFGRVMQEKLEPPAPATIPYDDTPVHVFMRRVYDRLVAEDGVCFSQLFSGSVHKSTLIATFLAVLELVRHRHAMAEQIQQYGDLQLKPGDEPLPDDAAARISVAEDATK